MQHFSGPSNAKVGGGDLSCEVGRQVSQVHLIKGNYVPGWSHEEWSTAHLEGAALGDSSGRLLTTQPGAAQNNASATFYWWSQSPRALPAAQDDEELCLPGGSAASSVHRSPPGLPNSAGKEERSEPGFLASLLCPFAVPIHTPKTATCTPRPRRRCGRRYFCLSTLLSPSFHKHPVRGTHRYLELARGG